MNIPSTVDRYDVTVLSLFDVLAEFDTTNTEILFQRSSYSIFTEVLPTKFKSNLFDSSCTMFVLLRQVIIDERIFKILLAFVVHYACGRLVGADPVTHVTFIFPSTTANTIRSFLYVDGGSAAVSAFELYSRGIALDAFNLAAAER